MATDRTLIRGAATVFSPSSFSAKSFAAASWRGIAQLVEETIQIVFGGSGWNFDVPAAKIKGKDRLGQDIEIEDEEIIEFLTMFALWRQMQQ